MALPDGSFVAAPERDRVRPDPFAREAVAQPEMPPGTLAMADGPVEPTEHERQIVAMVDRKFDEGRQDRQQHEPQWFMNAAFFRGNHSVTWSSVDNRLIQQPQIQPQRTKRQINRIFAKVRARRAKFLKNRPTWVVVPATTDIHDKLNARATGKVLEYIWRKLHLEQKFEEAIIWAEGCARGYWWFSWNAEAVGRVSMPADPMQPGSQKSVSEGVVGDVAVEAGSPFEVVVGDPSIASLAGQDEVIRAKVRTLDYLKAQYPDKALSIKAESAGDIFQYEQQIATLNTTSGIFGATSPLAQSDRKSDMQGNPNTVVVKEYFRRPSHDHPKGVYYVVAGGVLLKEQDELPFGLWDMENPFPCVEFIDVRSAGQYWGTTVLEQLIDLQREYNGIRSMISTQIRLMGHPKIFVAKQHQIPDGAWSPDAGEIIEYNARPGIKEPFTWEPSNIIGDAWRMIDLLKVEFDDVSQIYPAAEGSSAGTESGFHANLLQEATDMVHGPDVRAHELAIEEAAFKIRRIIKQGYTVPRLITVTSGAYEPEVFEFSAEEVDDYADIVVQAGSALPMLKGARIQAALDLYAKGVFGDPADPQVRRRLLNVLELGGMEDLYEYARVDEDMINIENSEAEDGQPIAEPRFFENHVLHWEGHISKLKSPAVMGWPPPQRMGLLSHAILHAKYINHAAAYEMSLEAGLEGLIPPPPPMGMPGMPGAPGGAPGQPQAPPGAGGPSGPPSPETSLAEAPDLTPTAGTAQAS